MLTQFSQQWKSQQSHPKVRPPKAQNPSFLQVAISTYDLFGRVHGMAAQLGFVMLHLKKQMRPKWRCLTMDSTIFGENQTKNIRTHT